RFRGDADHRLVRHVDRAAVAGADLDVRGLEHDALHLGDDHRLPRRPEVEAQLVAVLRLERLLPVFHGGRPAEDGLEEVLRHRRRRTTTALALLGVLLAGCATSSMARGRRAMDEGDFEGAARYFREATREAPTDASRWVAVGRAEMAAERWS